MLLILSLVLFCCSHVYGNIWLNNQIGFNSHVDVLYFNPLNNVTNPSDVKPLITLPKQTIYQGSTCLDKENNIYYVLGDHNPDLHLHITAITNDGNASTYPVPLLISNGQSQSCHILNSTVIIIGRDATKSELIVISFDPITHEMVKITSLPKLPVYSNLYLAAFDSINQVLVVMDDNYQLHGIGFPNGLQLGTIDARHYMPLQLHYDTETKLFWGVGLMISLRSSISIIALNTNNFQGSGTWLPPFELPKEFIGGELNAGCFDVTNRILISSLSVEKGNQDILVGINITSNQIAYKFPNEFPKSNYQGVQVDSRIMHIPSS